LFFLSDSSWPRLDSYCLVSIGGSVYSQFFLVLMCGLHWVKASFPRVNFELAKKLLQSEDALPAEEDLCR
jgi:hypothetical protein